MKKIDIGDLALIVYEALKKHNIDAVLTGGSVVSIYTKNRYESKDLDFISNDETYRIIEAMSSIGFTKTGKNFISPEYEFTVEFPTGPLKVGREEIPEEAEIDFRGKKIKILSPTNSIKDRLCGYYFWNDNQNLRQAIQLYRDVGGNINEIERWSISEGMEKKFNQFKLGLAIKPDEKDNSIKQKSKSSANITKGEFCKLHPTRRVRGKNKKVGLCWECLKKK